MQVGSVKQKANWYLVILVIGCAIIITLILYVKVEAEERAQEYSYLTGDYSHYIES